MEYFSETEKAVRLILVVDYYMIEKLGVYSVWVPKSQLDANGIPGQWITEKKMEEVRDTNKGGCHFEEWRGANGTCSGIGMTDKELAAFNSRKAAFENGKASYEKLLERAKALGIKVRSGMRRATIEAKMVEAGVAK